MRERKKIENDNWIASSYGKEDIATNARLELILEVLLDCRDLLQHLDKRSANQ